MRVVYDFAVVLPLSSSLGTCRNAVLSSLLAVTVSLYAFWVGEAMKEVSPGVPPPFTHPLQVIREHLNRPEVETFALVPMSSVPGLFLTKTRTASATSLLS